MIVGISLGARYLGIVGVQGERLSFRNILGRRYATTLAARLRRTLEELQPDLVVVDVPSQQRQTPANVEIERLAVRVLTELGVPTVRQRLTLARKGLVDEGRRGTRMNVHRKLVERFPRLRRRSTVREHREGARVSWSDMDRYWERAFAGLTLALWAQANPEATAFATKAGPDLG